MEIITLYNVELGSLETSLFTNVKTFSFLTEFIRSIMDRGNTRLLHLVINQKDVFVRTKADHDILMAMWKCGYEL